MRLSPAMTGERSRGFTLLELIVALAIFGLIAVMAYGGLATVLDQSVLTEEHAERLSALQKTYLVMQRDIEQVVPRPIRDEFGDELTPVAGTDLFQLTKGGWNNPANLTRSTLQRVGYTLEDQQLLRYTWTVLDRAQDSAPLEQALAAEISGMQVRYLGEDNSWEETWPPEITSGAPQPPTDAMPKAVEITLEHEYLGVIVWLFQLPQ